MPYFSFRSFRKMSPVISSIFCLALFFQFNNCSQIKSQNGEASSTSDSSNFSTADAPVDPLNPYVLQCIISSDGSKISASLATSVNHSSLGGLTNKISSLDWNQDTDLIVTLDNKCIFNQDFSDPILNYVDRNLINSELPKTVYVIKKESVTNLDLFIKSALASDCLISANKNKKIELYADFYPYQSHLMASSANPVAIDGTPIVMDSIFSYVAPAADKSVKVGIIDSGIDSTNPDLMNMIARNADGSIYGRNTSVDPSQGFTSDSSFHGTHVAGLVAAQYGNNLGVAGVYGKNVVLYPYRICNNIKEITMAGLINAIYFAIADHVDVINMSLGTPTDDPDLKKALEDAIKANITVVVAAGNSGVRLSTTSSAPSYPAMYSPDFAGLITVGSIDLKSKTRSLFSNYSPDYVDLFAPGSDGDIKDDPATVGVNENNQSGILSTLPMIYSPINGVGSALPDSSGGSFSIQGTSMATPIVTGAVAMAISVMKSKGKTFTNAQIEDYIKNGGSPTNSAYSSFVYHGNYLNLKTLFDFVKAKAESTTDSNAVAISTQPLSKKVVEGERVEFSVMAINGTTYTYQWYKNSTAISGATSKNYVINNAKAADGALYKVKVSSPEKKDATSDEHVSLKVAMKYCN